jgi:hypothetical protein
MCTLMAASRLLHHCYEVNSYDLAALGLTVCPTVIKSNPIQSTVISVVWRWGSKGEGSCAGEDRAKYSADRVCARDRRKGGLGGDKRQVQGLHDVRPRSIRASSASAIADYRLAPFAGRSLAAVPSLALDGNSRWQNIQRCGYTAAPLSLSLSPAHTRRRGGAHALSATTARETAHAWQLRIRPARQPLPARARPPIPPRAPLPLPLPPPPPPSRCPPLARLRP